MSTKKRRPLGNAIEEFVFGTNEAASPTPPEIVSSAPMPTASLTPEAALPATPPQEAALPVATPPQPAVSAPEPVRIQSKKPSLMSKLPAPIKNRRSGLPWICLKLSTTNCRCWWQRPGARKSIFCGCCWRTDSREWMGKSDRSRAYHQLSHITI